MGRLCEFLCLSSQKIEIIDPSNNALYLANDLEMDLRIKRM
jgi:hypothetical protein